MGEASSEKPHAVILPYPAQGHIPPIIHLACKLAAQGFKVTVVNIDSIHRKLQKQWRCPTGLDIRLAEVPCEIKLPSGMDSEWLKKEMAQPGSTLVALDGLESQVEELLLKLEPFPCCLIADFFYLWFVKLAKSLNIRPVTYWPGNAAWSALHHHMDLLVSNGDALQQEETREKVINYIPGVQDFDRSDLPDYMKKTSDSRNQFFQASKDCIRESEWTLVNSMAELEPQTFQAMQADNMRYVPVGPLIPQTDDAVLSSTLGAFSLRDEDSRCLEWLDNHEEHTVLYISLGSISTISESTFEEVAAGIQSSEQPFVWVIRPDLIERTAEGKYKEFIERTRQQGLVVSWAPQIRVLRHSSVGGFLSHCGWNSTFESLCNGVPLLCWPFFSDQQLNAKMVVDDWGFGKRFMRKQGVDLERVNVERRIREFMQGEEAEDIRLRVQAFKEKARRTMQAGGASDMSLQAFTRAMHDGSDH